MFQDLLKERNITSYALSQKSGVPYTTISDICSGKSKIQNCKSETVYKLAQALDVSMESLVLLGIRQNQRESFEIFKSNVCHRVKDAGDLSFIIETLESDRIRQLFDQKWYPEAFYLLAMLDYLSRENNIPLCTNYDDIRTKKLPRPVYPVSVLMMSEALHTDRYKKESMVESIPEFKRFNIIESEVRNIV